MTELKTAELEAARTMVPRDLVLSALIGIHRTVLRYEQDNTGQEETTTAADTAARQAWDLLLRTMHEIGVGSNSLSVSCYGLPSQLVGQAVAGSGGLGGFVHRLRQCIEHDLAADDVSLSWYDFCLQQDIHNDQLADVVEFHQALLQVQQPATDEFDAERHFRSCRFDIPLLLTDGSAGVVVSATLSPDRQNGEPLVEPADHGYGTRPGARVADEAFEAGVRAGLAAAKTLLSSYGQTSLASDFGRLKVIVGLLPLVRTPLTMGSAALPVALAALQYATQKSPHPELRLPRPVRRLSATGVIEEHRLVPLQEGLREKAEAVATEGLSDALLACTGRSDLPGVLAMVPSSEGVTLEVAAQEWWGDDVWNTWRDPARDLGIQDQGLIRLTEASFSGVIDADRHVATPLEVTLTERVLEERKKGNRRAWVVTGRPQSGRTHLALGLNRALAAADPALQIVVLSANRDSMMEADSLKRAWEIATHGSGGKPAVLILDDVEWLEGQDDLGDVLRDVVMALDATIVAFVRSDSTTLRLSGQVEDLDTFDTAATSHSMMDFAKAAAEQYESLRAPAGLIGTLVRYASPEPYLLMRLLESAAQVPFERNWGDRELSRRAEEVSEEFARNLVDLTDRQRETIAFVAALTVLGVHGPWALLQDEVDRRALEPYLTMYPSGLKIPSYAAAKAIVFQYPRVARPPFPGASPAFRQGEDPLRSLVVKAVRSLLQLAHASVPQVLERIVRNDSNMASQVLDTLAAQLYSVARDWHGEPALMARVLRLIERYVSEADRGLLAEALAKDLLVVEPESLRPQDLAISLRVVDQHSTHLKRRTSHRHMNGLLAAVQDRFQGPNLVKVLRNGDRPSDRLRLLRSVRFFYEARFVKIVEYCANDFVASPEPWTARDYWSLIAAFKELRRARPHNNRFEPMSLPAVLQMLERPPGKDLRSYLAWLGLKIACENSSALEPVFARSARELDLRLRGDVVSLVEGLASIHEIDGRAAHRLLTDVMRDGLLEERLRTRLASLPIIEAWLMVLSLSRLNAVLAWRVLSRDGRPREELVSALVAEIEQHPDARAFSKIVSALSNLDERFMPGSNGFGYALAEAVGLSRVQAMMDASRGRVVFHLLRALLDVQASYTDRLVDGVLERIDETIAANGEEHAPQLLVRMCTDRKLNKIRDICTEAAALPGVSSELLNRMLHCADEVALRAFHQLGGLLEPELSLAHPFAQLFREQGSTCGGLLRKDKPLVLLRAAAAVSPTLRRAGAEAPGKEAGRHVMTMLDQQDALAGGSLKPQDFSEALALISSLDEEGAAAFVVRNEQLLANAFAGASGTSAGNLVAAVHKLDPTLAHTVVTSNADATRRLVKRLTYESDPRTQAIMLRHLTSSALETISTDQWRSLSDEWFAEMSEIRQPVLIADRLRLLAAWNRGRGLEAAGRVSWSSVAVRVVHGQADDLAAVAALAGCAEALGQPDHARELLTAALKAETALAAMEPRIAARLLGTANILAPDIGRSMGRVMITGFHQYAISRRVLEPHRHLLGLGWYAHHLQEALLEPVTLGSEIHREVVGIAPLVRLWGHLWLSDAPWKDELLETALSEALESAQTVQWRPWAAATALIGICQTPDKEELDVQAWADYLIEDAAQAHPGLLDILIDVAPVQPPVQAALETIHDRLRLDLARPSWGSEIMARNVLRRLG